MREHDAAEHDFFGQFLRFGFDHHHGVAGGSHDQVERAGSRFALRGIERVFAINITDACRTDRAHERDAGNGQRSRRCDHRDDIGLGLAVIRQNLCDHVDFVVETFGEQRANRTVDQAAGQRFLFGRAALTLEEAAGNAACGREFFLVVDGQREEILAFLHTLGGGHGAQHHGFAIGCQHGAIGLTGNAAGFEGEGFAAPFHRYGFCVEHVFSF